MGEDEYESARLLGGYIGSALLRFILGFFIVFVVSRFWRAGAEFVWWLALVLFVSPVPLSMLSSLRYAQRPELAGMRWRFLMKLSTGSGVQWVIVIAVEALLWYWIGTRLGFV